MALTTMNKLTPAAALLVLAACAPTPLEEFRSASPSSQGLEVSLPSGNTTKQGLNDDSKPALMPGVTLLATLVVNGGVGLTLGIVASIVAEEPTVITEERAEWGPITQPLWKHSFRLKMEKAGEKTVSYVMERRLKSSTAESDYVVVLSGQHAFESLRAGAGTFTLHDLDAATRADVEYARNAQKDLDVKVGFRGGVPSDYAYSQLEGGDGSFEFRVTSDFVTRTSASELLTVKSRWHQSGEGRADVTGTGGDLKEEVRFTECWNTDLNRTHYHDTLGLFPTEGAASACGFETASYSTLVTP